MELQDESSETDSATRLRIAGLKATRPRQRVLEAFEHLGGHHSVDDVVGWLRDSGEPLPRGSVYGIVDDLARCGLLTLVDAAAGATLYEVHRHDHSHFVCNSCGSIFDVPAPGAMNLPEMSQIGTVTNIQVVIRGACRACEAQTK